MKHNLLFFCGFLLCAATMTAYAQSGNIEGSSLSWSISSGTLTISGNGPMPDFGQNPSPWDIHKTSITSVVIGNGVTSIGDNAFNCPESSKLMSVTIPNSVKSIGNYAFSGNRKLRSFTIPNEVDRIGDGVFYDCSGLTSIVIPESVTSIGELAFSWCTGLTSIVIPNSVMSIGDLAFSWCTGLTSVTIGESVEFIGNFAFRESSSLIKVINYRPIPQYIIGKDVFPSSVSGPGYDNSPTLRVPAGSVESYRDDVGWVFDDIKAIDEIDECITDTDEEGVITWTFCDGTLTISGNGNMPAGNDYVMPWGNYKTWVTSVIIENGITSVSPFAFSNYSRLSSIVIPESVTSIGESAFSNCERLTSVNIPRRVTSIADDTFWGCERLMSISIPESVTEIGSNAFSFCFNLVEVTNYAATPQNIIQKDVFQYVNINEITLRVPDGKRDTYLKAPVWNEFEPIEEMTLPTRDLGYSLEMIEGEVYIAVEINVPAGGEAIWTPNYNPVSRGNLFLFKFSNFAQNNDDIRLNCIVYNANGSIVARYAVVVRSGRITITTKPAVTNAKISLYVKMRNDNVDLLDYISYAGGKYISDVIPAGEYIISVNAPDYLFTYYNTKGLVIVDWTEDVTWISLADGIDKSVTVELTKMIKPTGDITISGKLLDASSLKASVLPIAKSTVVLSTESTPKATGEYGWTIIATTIPDENGYYEFTGLPPGIYRVTVEIAGFELEREIFVDAMNGDITQDFNNLNFTINDENKTISAVLSVTGVRIDNATLALKIGDSEKLTAIIAPSNAVNKGITWSSNATAVATVNDDGTVKAIASGTATITVTTKEGNHSATCSVTVTGPTMGINISDAPLARVYPNPTTDGKITLEFDTHGICQVTITDMTGKVLLRQSVTGQITQLDVSNYPAGVYLLVIDDGKQQSITRIIRY